MDTDLTAVLVASGSLLVSLVALLVAYFEKRAAEVSAKAAESAERRAEAIERRNRFGWRIEILDVGLYALRNTGWETAIKVTITSEMRAEFRTGEPKTLRPGEAIVLVVLMSAKGKPVDPTLHITWKVKNEPATHTWTEPFPQRPPTEKELNTHLYRTHGYQNPSD